MLNRSPPSETGDACLDRAVARWALDTRLAPLFARSGAPLLVMDEAARRILRAAGQLSGLPAAISDADGHLLPGLRFAEQIQRAGASDTGPRLARIRFDPRGIVRPTACLIARVAPEAGISDAPLTLIVPTEPLPVLRAIPAHPRMDPHPRKDPRPAMSSPAADEGEIGSASASVAAEESVAQPDRLLWASDAEGVVTKLVGAGPDLAASLVNRRWQALADEGVIVGEALLHALAARQTFRACSLLVRPGSAGACAFEVSGAPVARPNQPFSGFSGFGLLRERRPAEATGAVIAEGSDEASAPVPPEPSVAPPSRDRAVKPPAASVMDEASLTAGDGGGGENPLRDAETTAGSRLQALASIPSSGTPAMPPVVSDDPLEPEAEAGGHAAATTPPAAPERAPPSADLSTHEHAAFREIARALGARFAGDDEAPDRASENGGRGAVMPFPVSTPSHQNAAIEAAIVAALDRLPAGVLVHRDGTIAFANRRVLELTGFEDPGAMQAAGGLTPLFRQRDAEVPGRADDEAISVTSGSGSLTGLLIERSRVEWEGRPAELLLVRAANTIDPLRDQAAQALLQVREAAKEREARTLLDHLEEGVATLDDGGRVLTLNRSATGLLSGDAREIVGEAFSDLFVPDSAPLISAGLQEARETGTGAPRTVVPRGQTTALRLRLAGLPTSNTARFCATFAVQPAAPSPAGPETVPAAERARPMLPRRSPMDAVRAADFVARVSHEIRTPLNGILGFADAMLSEPFGPLGSEQYRGSLRDIRASGEHVLGVVEDLFDLARIEAGQVELAFADLALNEVVSTCIAEMQPQAARDRIVVRTSLSPDLRPLRADARSMRQATFNVIANALRHTEAGGQIIVSTTAAERGEIAFRVRDTGIGMTEEEIAEALEPFRQADPALARHAGGAGLGLTLTKALIEANRGQFRISSRKNEGTLVEMTFPPPQALSA